MSDRRVSVWEDSIERYLDRVTHDLKELERRIVKLEAFIGAVRNERRLLRHGGEDLGPGGL